MTPDSPPAPRPYRRLSVPAFYPVPTRTRRDGWTIERQADFLGMLAETGSVIGACEAVGISRKSAYQLRARPGAESFAAAWDAALGMPARKVTPPARDLLACNPLVRLVMFRRQIADRGTPLPTARCGGGFARPAATVQGDRCRPDGDSARSWRRLASLAWPRQGC